MIFAVLPVKNLRNAKQRLSGLLSAAQRQALAFLLYKRTLDTLCQATDIDQLVVATSDPEIADYARRSHVMVFDENEQISHSASADAACLRALQMGARTVLLVPIDVPLVTASDFNHLASAARPGLIVVPSSDGTGTNALVRTPPDVMQCFFGPGSFRAHMDQARAKGIPAEELRLQGLMFDLDTPEDVTELLSRAPDTPISTFLRAACDLK
jgi:2-phospho-L-lactate/phosphoenolpyruvate guanylyltransferase